MVNRPVKRINCVTSVAMPLLELALQWLLAQSPVDSVILGVSKLEHLEQNVQAAEGTLDEETLAACDEVWGTLRGNHFRYNR